MTVIYTPATNQRQRPLGSKQTNGRTDPPDRVTFSADAAGKNYIIQKYSAANSRSQFDSK